MRFRLVLFTIASMSLGCTHVALERRTIQQASTVTDLQHQQVMDNLAMFAGNPDALAWHVKLGGGLVQVADQGNAGFQANLANSISANAQYIFSPSVSAQRGVLGQWNVEPAVDTDDLELLNLAYRHAVRPNDPELKKDIRSAIWELSLSYDIKPGWWVILDVATDAAKENFEEIQRDLQKAGMPPNVQQLDDASKALEAAVDKQRRGVESPDINNEMIKFEFNLKSVRSMVKQWQQEIEPLGRTPQAEALQLVDRKLNSMLARNKARRLEVEEAIRNLGPSKDFDNGRDRNKPRAEIQADEGRTPNQATQGLPPALPPTAADTGQRLSPDRGDALDDFLYLVGSRKYITSKFHGQALPRNPGLVDQAQQKVETLKRMLDEETFTRWFYCGSKKDVPKCACYTGYYRNCGRETYVWVMPNQLKALKEFTMTILSLAPRERMESFAFPGAAFNPTLR